MVFGGGAAISARRTLQGDLPPNSAEIRTVLTLGTFTVEFFKRSTDGEVGEIFETKTMTFTGETSFHQWAQQALSARRCDNYNGEWPDAVRACDLKGIEIYRWSQ